VDVLSTFASAVSRQKSEKFPQKVYVYKTFFSLYCGVKSLSVGSVVYFSFVQYIISVVDIDNSCSRLVELIASRLHHEYVYNFYCIIRRVGKIAKSDY
jgi:hypothetical protein